MPLYATWNLDWIFYKTSPYKIQQFVKITKNLFKWKKIIFKYFPWGEKLQVSFSWKILYFDLEKDIASQIEKLKTLKNQLPEKYTNANIIDVWTLSNGIYVNYVLEKK